VTIEIPMDDENMESFVFAIVKKKAEKQFIKDNPDVKECTTVITKLPPEFPKSYSVLSETEELVNKFIYEAVIKTLAKNEHDVQEIYFTDLYFDKTYKKNAQIYLHIY